MTQPRRRQAMVLQRHPVPANPVKLQSVPSDVAALRGLSVVEMEVGSRCNRACSYCPVSLDPRPSVPVRMSDEVVLATVEQLAQAEFAGRISYHLYNEPLLRTDLHRLVGIVRAYLPNALQVLNTNGDLLTDERYAVLREAGVDYFYVTRHSEGDYPERDFQVVQPFVNLTLTNRGGTLEHLPAATEQHLRTPCYAPTEMLIVTVTGDVLLCYEDAHRDHVLGNLLQTPIAEILRSERVRSLQQRLAAGDRSVSAMCQACSNVSHHQPGLSAIETPILEATGIDRDDDAIARLKARATDALAIAGRRTSDSSR